MSFSFRIASPWRRGAPTALFVTALAFSFSPAAAQTSSETQRLTPLTVTAVRALDSATPVPFATTTLSGDALRASPNVTVDGSLRGIAGFSLFRRTDSLVAHPTAQGVSLRGLGPSGASRSLILLDGVPLNDPFGGWVAWSKVPRESLASIELVPGAGGTAWGNAALGGVIQLFTESPTVPRQRLAVRAGSLDTWDVETQLTLPVGSGSAQFLGRTFSTHGYFTVAPERRGPIDTRAASRARWGTLRFRQPFGADDRTVATVTVRRFAEDRDNGTPYQRNATDESFASVALDTRVSDAFRWNAIAYAQSQSFSSTFGAVNATRTAETPASNQFDVPATALGAAWVGEWSPDENALTTFGIDARDVRGETREESAYSNGAFTRQRYAGGRQSIAGAFVMHSRRLAPDLRAAFGLRADTWRETDGHRRDYLNAALVGDERFRSRRGEALSPSAGLSFDVSESLRLHASAQHAFRRPTLNELYRPFRVGNVITDANPALRTETVTSGELGLTFRSLRTSALTLDATLFWNELRDAVGNVTIAQGPGNFPGIGFVPAGGEGRRRLNLDRSRVRGLSLSADYAFTSALSFNASYLYNDATVTRASVAPHLAGRRLAQVPRHTAAAGLTFKLNRVTVAPRLRYIGAQFEDDQNTLRLAPAAIVDVSISATLTQHTELFVTAENVFDERIETGRSADGLVNLGTPRLLLLGLRLTF